VSRTSHHLFQPLLYQVATGILSEGVIAPSTREVLRRQRNAKVLLGDITEIDLEAKTVTSQLRESKTVIPYDYLIVAAGAGQSYFGNDKFDSFAPGLKTIDDALELRGRIFGAFEMAEVVTDPVERMRQLTFIVVGGGPTGVEVAGQIAELSRTTLAKDFRAIDPREARVILVEGAPQVLGSFGHELSGEAKRELQKLGVEVLTGYKVIDLDAQAVEIEDTFGNRSRIASACKIWAAGVQASPLAATLAEQSGAGLDRAGRIQVQPDLTLPGHPDVFVVGDMMALDKLPGVAQVAIQGGRHAARSIVSGERTPFTYVDKGSMATIARFSAVASIGRLQLSGFVAWAAWLLVHLMYIIGFKSQITALLHWVVSFLGRGRAERTTTRQQIAGRLALREVGEQFPPVPGVKEQAID
jgi:NADH dehydrogenase